LDSRFYGFDFKFFDRSFWNSDEGNAFATAEGNQTDVVLARQHFQEPQRLRFLLDRDGLVYAHEKMSSMQRGQEEDDPEEAKQDDPSSGDSSRDSSRDSTDSNEDDIL